MVRRYGHHHVVFSLGLNADLGATAVCSSQMGVLFPRPKYDGALGMWYGKVRGWRGLKTC